MTAENVKWCSSFGNSLAISQKMNIDFSYDPAILLFGTYQEN